MKKAVKPQRGRPATGQMPKRYLRMNDEDWRDVEEAADAAGESTSAYIRRVLLENIKRTARKNGAAGN